MPTPEPNGIHHVALRVRDFDASARFYKEGLGCREVCRWGSGDGRAIMLAVGNNNHIEIFAGGGDLKPEGAILHLAISTSDTDAATARAIAAGAKIIMKPSDVDVDATPKPFKVRISFCTGPDGEVIEFFQQR